MLEDFCTNVLNRGVRLIKVSFKANKGNKFWDFGYCPLNKGCPLNTGFTVFCFILIYSIVTTVMYLHLTTEECVLFQLSYSLENSAHYGVL